VTSRSEPHTAFTLSSMRRPTPIACPAAAAAALLLTLLAACGPPETLPDGTPTWQSEEFAASLPATEPVAFIAYARAAEFQSHGVTYVEDWDDQRLIDLAAAWCDDGASVHSDVIGAELDRLGLDVTLGRNFVPPPPVDELLTRVAYLHEPGLCTAI